MSDIIYMLLPDDKIEVVTNCDNNGDYNGDNIIVENGFGLTKEVMLELGLHSSQVWDYTNEKPIVPSI